MPVWVTAGPGMMTVQDRIMEQRFLSSIGRGVAGHAEGFWGDSEVLKAGASTL